MHEESVNLNLRNETSLFIQNNSLSMVIAWSPLSRIKQTIIELQTHTQNANKENTLPQVNV